MSFSINALMQGGTGAVSATKDTISQALQAEAQRLRDERFAELTKVQMAYGSELKKGEAGYASELKRAPLLKAGQEAESEIARVSQPVGDAGPQQPATNMQKGIIYSQAYLRNAEPEAAAAAQKIGIEDMPKSEEVKALTTSKAEIAQLHVQSQLDRAETLKEIADAKNANALLLKDMQIQMMREKQANGKVDTATSRMLITSEDVNINANTRLLAAANSRLENLRGKSQAAERARVEEEITGYKEDIKRSKTIKMGLFKDLGIVPSDADTGGTAAPSAAPKSPNSKDPLGLFTK